MTQSKTNKITFTKATPDDFYHTITADNINGRHLRVHEKYQHSIYAKAEILPKKNILPFLYEITITYFNEENYETRYIFLSDKLTKATNDTLKTIKETLTGCKIVNLNIQVGKPIEKLKT